MQRLNRYYRRSRIAEPKFRLLTRHFALDLTANDAAQLTGLSHRSTITIFGKIRQRIADECERQSPFKDGDVEVDESYFGPHRVRGKRGRGASGKTIVFGLLKRADKVSPDIVPDCKKATLQAIIRGRVSVDAVIPFDGWRGYDGLVDVGYAKHYRVHHGQDEFVRGTAHVNGIESFRSYAKRRLQKFNGVPATTFNLHLKECEWRFNHRHDNLYLELLRLLRQECLQQNWFISLDDAKGIVEDWREDYSEERPHSSLKQQTPSAFVAQWKQTRTALEAGILTLETVQL